MADDRRVYSDEEFALILRQAAELASRAEPPGPSSAGLTLTEMKAAAAQAVWTPPSSSGRRGCWPPTLAAAPEPEATVVADAELTGA